MSLVFIHTFNRSFRVEPAEYSLETSFDISVLKRAMERISNCQTGNKSF